MRESAKPSLLILISSFPASPRDGTCGYIREFAESLTASFRVTVLAPPDRFASGEPERRFELIRSGSVSPASLDRFQAGSDFNQLPSEGWAVKTASAASMLAFFLTALRLARRADVICSHWMAPAGVVGAVLSRLLGKPHVVIEHSGALHLLRRTRVGRRVLRFVAGASDRVVTVSEHLRGLLVSECPGRDVEVIPMGLDSKWFVEAGRASAGTDGARPTIGFLGRLIEIKGVEILLRAAALLEGARVVIAGDGERRNDLERLARDLSVDCEFVGRIGIDERGAFLSRCDVVVIPSLAFPDGRTEGLPVVCLEAMAAGKTVVASRVGGLAEVIADGENGLLFEPGDHVALVAKLRTVLGDWNLRERLGENARATAAGYDWQVIAPRFARILLDALRTNEPIISDRRAEPGRAGG